MTTTTTVPQTVLPFDCYHVKLHLTISEEDRCLYDRFGVNHFSVKVDCEEEDDSLKFVGRVTIDKCDCTKALFDVYVSLPFRRDYVALYQKLLDYLKEHEISEPTPYDVIKALDTKTLHESRRFNICAGSGKHEVEVASFEVNPLPYNVLSSGVLNECCKYEVFRVNCLFQSDYCGLLEEQDLHQFCLLEPLLGGMNTFRIIFPLTKEIKCLVPDFGLGGTLANAVSSVGRKVKVRLSISSPFKLVIPATLTVDKENCTACLDYYFHPKDKNSLVVHSGYESKFDKLGCVADYVQEVGLQKMWNYNIEARETLEDLFNSKAVRLFLQNGIKLLKTATKIEVLGVDKCSETVLFVFQLCTVAFNPEQNPPAPNEGAITYVSSCGIKSSSCDYCYETLNAQERSYTTTTTVAPAPG